MSRRACRRGLGSASQTVRCQLWSGRGRRRSRISLPFAGLYKYAISSTYDHYLTKRIYRRQRTVHLQQGVCETARKAWHTNEPMTGFRGSLFTSPTGLYAQFIPASFSSSADASVTRSATSGEPVAASAIAPGLSTRRSHQRNLIKNPARTIECQLRRY